MRPTTLYHYTDQRGLLGILQSAVIWATSVRHLNDSSEFRYAMSLVDGETLAMPYGASGSYGRFLDDYRTAVNEVRDESVYVTSFSRHGDLLSQWRAYGRPGDAYAIGFDSGLLDDLAARQAFRLVPCSYSREQHIELLRALFTSLPEHDRSPAAFAHGVRELAPSFKHEAFSEEAEWRLVSPYRLRPSFRPGRYFPIPYVVFELSPHQQPLPLAELLVGPTPQPEDALVAARALLDAHHLPEVTVRLSQIPFRG